MMHLGHTPGAPKYDTQPLVVPVVSGFVPVDERKKRGLFTPVYPGVREERVQVPMRTVVCYECGRRSQIPEAALSAHCVHCRAHLSTADVELKPGTRRLRVRTLGDVTLPADVTLSHLNIVCRHLTLAGTASGSLRCSGTLTLRGDARVDGQVQATSLVVPPGAAVAITPGATVDDAEVGGRLVGSLHALHSVHIASGGELVGDCQTPRLVVDPAGSHRGAFTRTS